MNKLEIEKILALAKKAGAEVAEVYQVSSNSAPVSFEANRLKKVEISQSTGCALRLWQQGCPGLAVAYGKVEPETLVTKAIALSQLNPPETPELANPREVIYPSKGQVIQNETLVDLGKEAIALIREKYPEVICSAELESETQTTTLVNSQGLYCEYSDIQHSCYLGVEWVRGEDFLGIYDGESTETELNITQIINKLNQRLEWSQKNVETPKGKQAILFTPNGASLLWESVVAALNSKRVIEKSSPWSEKEGEIVVSEMLTFSQRPDLPGTTCPFDDEGTPTQDLSLIEKGRIKQFYSDRTNAKILSEESTGNGFRPSLSHYPTPSLINLTLEPGTGDLTSLAQQLENGLIVDQILGGGPDISGDFSINLDLGYRVYQGEIIGRVKDTMVTGNVYEALKKVIALGSDINIQDFYKTPSVIVEGLSVVS